MLLVLLVAAALLLIEAPGAAANAARRRRPLFPRPHAWVVGTVVLVEIALLLGWILLGRPR
jgi:hypothetical protein